MHKRFVANIIARISLVVCLTMGFPLAWAVHDDVHSKEVFAFAETIFFVLILSSSVLWFCRINKKDYKKINPKDGLAIVGLSWIFLSAFGALPLFLSGVVDSYTDSFFEIASGFTTTGATIFSDIEALPRGILFWRSLTHWLGGMGIIVLYIALLPALGSNAFQLYKAEAPGLTVERVEPRLKETAKNLWSIYFFLTFFQVLLLMFGKMPFFDALCHTFGTVATGGFSTQNASIGAYGPYIQWVIIFFMFMAGMNFVWHYQTLHGRPLSMWKSEEFRVYFILALVTSLVFSWVLGAYGLSESPIRDSIFQVVGILTTTGFVSVNFELWPSLLKYILVLLMFVGGCGGSTGGGMKVIRVYLAIKISLRSGVQTIFPNAILPVKMDGKPLPNTIVNGILAYFTIFIFLFFIGSGIFLLTESCDLVTAMTATISALGNIGPGLNKVGATENYGWVSASGKWLLTFLMLAGRLELYSILVLFMPMTWRK